MTASRQLRSHTRQSLRKDRRNWRRIDLSLATKLLSRDGTEFEGTTINVSGGGVLVASNAPVTAGEELICYVDQLGRTRGEVIRAENDEIAIATIGTTVKRDRFVDQLTWIWNRDRLGLDEERRAERMTAQSGPVVVELANGRAIQCSVTDVSIVGMALETTAPKPMIGDIVTVGPQRGRVARYLEKGFAVDFTRH